MEKIFENIIDTAMNAPHMIFISLAAAVIFIIGGIVLYKKRESIRGWRWPGITCTLLGCASLVTNVVQYAVR